MHSDATPSGSPIILGLGANLGNPIAQIHDALASIGRFVLLESVSSIYRTAPVGGIEQPDFFNLVCSGRFEGSSTDLHQRLVGIENRMGRTRRVRFGPRLIDIDILDFAATVVDLPALTLPHPRLHERAFVLVPLHEILPSWRHPVLGRSASELLQSLPTAERVELAAPPPQPSSL